jgi:hypothetical protein
MVPLDRLRINFNAVYLANLISLFSFYCASKFICALNANWVMKEQNHTTARKPGFSSKFKVQNHLSKNRSNRRILNDF